MTTQTMTTPQVPARPPRSHLQWLLGFGMIAVIAFGWKYPLLGFMVPLTMGVGIAGSFSHGRYVCGNLCPRGSFLDTLFWGVSARRPPPRLVTDGRFRWGVFAALMAGMAWQISLEPGNPLHWGRVFWGMCTATTLVAMVLGVFYRGRTWCEFCPMGTLSATIGGERHQLRIDPACEECNSCGEQCPLGFTIPNDKPSGALQRKDCLKCSDCVKVCRKGALSWPH